jgi:trypsin
MFVHPRYDFRDLDADVAILKLSAPIAKSNTVGYATLAAAGSDPSAGSMVTAAGWYKIYTNKM